MTLQHVTAADMKGFLGLCCIALLLIAPTHTELSPAHTGTCKHPSWSIKHQRQCKFPPATGLTLIRESLLLSCLMRTLLSNAISTVVNKPSHGAASELCGGGGRGGHAQLSCHLCDTKVPLLRAFQLPKATTSLPSLAWSVCKLGPDRRRRRRRKGGFGSPPEAGFRHRDTSPLSHVCCRARGSTRGCSVAFPAALLISTNSIFGFAP